MLRLCAAGVLQEQACLDRSVLGSTFRHSRKTRWRASSTGASFSSRSERDTPQRDSRASSEPEITSTANALVRHLVKLREDRGYREAEGSVVVPGLELLAEIAQSARLAGAAARQRGGGDGRAELRARVLLLARGQAIPPGVVADRVVVGSDEVVKKASGLLSASGVGAVAELYRPAVAQPSLEEAGAASRVLVLDGVQDPGNLGTLLRTAAAFRWGAVCLMPGCCDPFNDKALRAAKGASFALPLWAPSWAFLEELKERTGLLLLAADPRAGEGSLRRAMAARGPDPRAWLALGSEGSGLGAEALRLCSPVSIPAAGGMESVNVAVAGGILMYLLSQKEGQQEEPRG